MEICKLEHIRKDYIMGETVSPLKDATLTVSSGDFITVEGPSGIGKSTLLYVMGTMLQWEAGTYTFEGRDVSAMTDNEKSDLRAEKIGFMFQDTNLIQALTLRENLIFAQQVGGKKPDKDKVDELLMEFDLLDRGDFFPHQLSGGQRRRAMAARCLIHNPLLILADEPTNDLDSIWAEKIIQMLKREAGRGAGVVMVTHNTHWAKQANRRCYLEDGALFPVKEETAAL